MDMIVSREKWTEFVRNCQIEWHHDDEQELNYDEEHAKHEHVKTQITEIKLKLIQGQVHKAEDVERVMTDMFEKFKSKIKKNQSFFCDFSM